MRHQFCNALKFAKANSLPSVVMIDEALIIRSHQDGNLNFVMEEVVAVKCKIGLILIRNICSSTCNLLDRPCTLLSMFSKNSKAATPYASCSE